MSLIKPQILAAISGAIAAYMADEEACQRAAADPVAKRAEIIDNYETLLYNPYIAASRGFVDQVIRPSQTRPRLIEALEILSTKRETLPAKKHGNIPV